MNETITKRLIKSKIKIRYIKTNDLALKIKGCIEIVLSVLVLILLLTYHYLSSLIELTYSINWFGIVYQGESRFDLVNLTFILGFVLQIILIISFLISKDRFKNVGCFKLILTFLVLGILIPFKLTTIEDGIKLFNFFGIILEGHHDVLVVDTILYLGIFLQIIVMLLIKIEGERSVKK